MSVTDSLYCVPLPAQPVYCLRVREEVVMSLVENPQSRFYHSRGLRLHYLDWGNVDAPLLILLHGGLEHARVWDQLARQLCADWQDPRRGAITD